MFSRNAGYKKGNGEKRLVEKQVAGTDVLQQEF